MPTDPEARSAVTPPAEAPARPSLHAFMAGLIDYAGLFPPAKLPLDEAIRAYARYRRLPERWMLGRFVCPADRLEALSAHAGLFETDPPFRFSVLGGTAETAHGFLDRLAADLEAVRAFRVRHPGRVAVDGFEVKLPPDVLAGPGPKLLLQLLHETYERALALGKAPFAFYFEASLEAGWPRRLSNTIGAIAAHNGNWTERARRWPAGFKLRCGGVEASAFPSVEQIALAVAGCRSAGVRLKATAGLHHPVRHYSEMVSTEMHGFLNVFGAAVLAFTHALTERELVAVLVEEDPARFRFEPDAFAWDRYRVPLDRIARARADFALSFGSCSFEEPLDDLRALGLL